VVNPRIYTPVPLLDGETLQLDAAASRHLASALRLQVGDRVTLFNGGGGEYSAHIHGIERKQVSVKIGAFNAREAESILDIHLGIAISRGERMDWIIQKSTELGVSAIFPLFSERCEVKLSGERAAKRLHHWQRVAISACEQSGRNRVPQVALPRPLGEWCAETRAEVKLVLHHRAGPVEQGPEFAFTTALLIGPEGGLTGAEIALAESFDFMPMALGPRVLRTETAPLAAIAILQARWGDMGPEG
jgi:16S rRNA (uracil1498-N3)-methyltransferase